MLNEIQQCFIARLSSENDMQTLICNGADVKKV